LKIGARSGVYAIATSAVVTGGVVAGGVGADGVEATGAVELPDVVDALVQDAGLVGPSGTPFEHPDGVPIARSATASLQRVAGVSVTG
jgi:hypothetical protein